MPGKPLMIALVFFTVVFGVALWWFQIYAFYDKEAAASRDLGFGLGEVTAFEGISASTSPLKERACFEWAGETYAALPKATEPTPLLAPFWFDCFDAEAIQIDLDQGAATAYVAAVNDPDGFDVMVAVYPDGRGFLWRQLGEKAN